MVRRILNLPPVIRVFSMCQALSQHFLQRLALFLPCTRLLKSVCCVNDSIGLMVLALSHSM